jgi:hypothetical protein
MARIVGGIFLVWPWIATLGLGVAYLWLTPELRQRIYLIPFNSTFMLPVFVFGLALLNAWMSPPSSLRDGAPAE